MLAMWGRQPDISQLGCLSTNPGKGQLVQCKNKIYNDSISVLDTTTKSDSFLLTLEAIWIRDIKPKINTKDEFRSRELIIRI